MAFWVGILLTAVIIGTGALVYLEWRQWARPYNRGTE